MFEERERQRERHIATLTWQGDEFGDARQLDARIRFDDAVAMKKSQTTIDVQKGNNKPQQMSFELRCFFVTTTTNNK